MNAKHVGNQLTAWVEVTRSKIAHQRYLARLEASPADQARLLAEAMELELLCEEMQACVRHYSTVRQLRGAVHYTLQAMRRELDRLPQVDQDQQATDEPTARMEGRVQAYRAAVTTLSAIVGAGER